MEALALDYYWITENSDQAYYNVVGGKPERFLPKVYNPECGHTIWWGPGLVLPLDEAEIPGIKPYLKRAEQYEPISPEEWTTVLELIARATSGTSLSRLPIVPGMRIGTVDIVYTCRKDIPDYMSFPSAEIFSERLVQKLGSFSDVIVYPVSAQRKSAKKDVEQCAYSELLPLTTARFAPVSEYRRTTCPVCGKGVGSSYRYGIIDSTGIEGIDIVRADNGHIYYSEHFKQKAEAAGVRGLTFIPGWRMSSDRSPSEILNDMEFERQTGRPPNVSRPTGY